jgi:hypothetical protein
VASLDFWVAVAPLRSEYVADGCRAARAWADAPCGGAGDELFVRLSRAALRLTPEDLDAVLDVAYDALIAPDCLDPSLKYNMLMSLEQDLASIASGPNAH